MLYKAFDGRTQHIDPWIDAGRIFVAYNSQLEQAARQGYPRGCSQEQGNSKPELQETAYVWQGDVVS